MGVINIGVAAHITAASPGGKRYAPTLFSEQRADIGNGIWLCQDCGKLIDSDEKTYSPILLQGWKEQAERVALDAIGGIHRRSIAVFERRLSGHSNFVWDVAVTPDGRRIISASNDKSIRIWDPASGGAVAVLEGHEAFVCSIAVSRDGLAIASGAMDGRVIVWSIPTGERKGDFQNAAGDAKVAWQQNDQALVTGGADGAIALWHTGTWLPISRSKVHDGPILKVICLQDCSRVVSVSADRTIRISNINAGQCTDVFRGHADEVNSVAVAPDERYLVSASSDKTLRIWDLQGGGCCHVLCGHSEIVWRVAISPDGKLLASGSADNTVCIWSLDSGGLLQTLPHPDCIAAVAFSPHGDRLVVGCDDAHVYLYKLSDY